jgi:hypothetical protein
VVFSGTVPRWHPRWRRSRGPLSAASLRVVTARTPHRHALLAETNNAERPAHSCRCALPLCRRSTNGFQYDGGESVDQWCRVEVGLQQG